MITGISISNFGPVSDAVQSLELRPQTIMVGPNNAGKSSFLAAYAFVALQRFDPFLTKFQSYDECVYGHHQGRQVSVELRAEFGGRGVMRKIEMPNPPRTAGPWNSHSSFRYGNNQSGNVFVSQTGSQQDQEALSRLLQNTWYLGSGRVFVRRVANILQEARTIDPLGQNVIEFLLERWTSQDPLWTEAQSWLAKIDPSMSILKSPLRGNMASVETRRKAGPDEFDVNVALQGGGIQRALQIVSAVVFSPRGTVLIIEEPEMNLHRESIEAIADLFNKAVNEWDKQIIVTTHSLDLLRAYISDVGPGERRGSTHVKADPAKFKLLRFTTDEGGVAIDNSYDLGSKEFRQIMSDFKVMWG